MTNPPLTPQERQKYLAKYAQQLGCDPTPYAVACTIMKSQKQYFSAALFMLGLSARDEEQVAYARKCSEYLKKYINDDPSGVTPEWLYEFCTAYVSEVDTSYRW